MFVIHTNHTFPTLLVNPTTQVMMLKLNEQMSASDYYEFTSEFALFLGRIPGRPDKTF